MHETAQGLYHSLEGKTANTRSEMLTILSGSDWTEE